MAVRLREPKHGYCPDCGEGIHNRDAHAEACTGIDPVQDALNRGDESMAARLTTEREQGYFTGWYSCGCPGHGWVKTGGRCENLRDRRPVMRPVQ